MSKKTKGKGKAALKADPVFEEGDLVGAKIKGHPLWPGQIEKVFSTNNNNKRRYRIRFFATDDISTSGTQVLKHFKDLTLQERTCKTKNLQAKFNEALRLCQKAADSLASVKTEGDHADELISSANPSTSVSPEPPVSVIKFGRRSIKSESQAAEKVQESIVAPTPALTEVPTPSPPPPTPPPPPKSDCNTGQKTKKQNKTPTTKKKKNRDKKSHNDLTNLAKSPKYEGENVMVAFNIQTTIAKLQEKVAKKIEEKEARKKEQREMKLTKKAAVKLEIINKNLEKFSNISRKLSIATSVDQINVSEWKATVQIYNTVLPVLDRCIEHFSNDSQKLTNPSDCRKCHEILANVVEHLIATGKNNQIPDDIKKEAHECHKLLKQHKRIKNFVNGNVKNAMIERKENE